MKQIWEHNVVETIDLSHTIGDNEREGWEVAAFNLLRTYRDADHAVDVPVWVVVFKRRLE